MNDPGLKILVCGGRDFDQRSLLFSTLDALNDPVDDMYRGPISCVVHGAQRKRRGSEWIGADYLAEEWARSCEIAYRAHPAPWHSHGAWCKCGAPLPAVCKAAGMWRNEEMLRREHMKSWPISLVVAFQGGAGTAGMVRLAREAGIDVLEVK